SDVPVKVNRSPHWILRHEPLELRAVVPCPIVFEPGAVILPARIVEGIGGSAAAEAGLSEWRVRIARRHRPGPLPEGDGTAEDVGEEVARPLRVRPRQILVDTDSGKETCGHRGSIQLLRGCPAVVEECGLGRVNSLARATPLGIVLEARDTSADDGRQTIAG